MATKFTTVWSSWTLLIHVIIKLTQDYLLATPKVAVYCYKLRKHAAQFRREACQPAFRARKTAIGQEGRRQPTKKKLESDEQDEQLVGLTKMLKDREGELEQVKIKVESLQEEVEELRCDITQLRSIIFVPPFYFSVQEVSQLRLHKEQWFSPPFYTHVPNGYKMCISIDCGGSDEGAGTHISVYANLMKGEHDDVLRWPFRGTITIRLINRRSDTSHCEHDIPFVGDTSRDIAGRVTKQDIAESGLGVPKFLPLLKLNPSETVEYIRNDSLQFCVVKVRIDARR